MRAHICDRTTCLSLHYLYTSIKTPMEANVPVNMRKNRAMISKFRPCIPTALSHSAPQSVSFVAFVVLNMNDCLRYTLHQWNNILAELKSGYAMRFYLSLEPCEWAKVIHIFLPLSNNSVINWCQFNINLIKTIQHLQLNSMCKMS